jgi:hypothetical protein
MHNYHEISLEHVRAPNVPLTVGERIHPFDREPCWYFAARVEDGRKNTVPTCTVFYI